MTVAFEEMCAEGSKTMKVTTADLLEEPGSVHWAVVSKVLWPMGVLSRSLTFSCTKEVEGWEVVREEAQGGIGPVVHQRCQQGPGNTAKKAI